MSHRGISAELDRLGIGTSKSPQRRSFADDNALRFSEKRAKGGHVESYFLRANDPALPRALWLKATVFAPKNGAVTADIWCALFDADNQQGHTWAHRQTVDFEDAHFLGRPLEIAIAGCRFRFGVDGGYAQGRLPLDSGGACEWDLRWKNAGSALGAPLSLYPTRSLEEGFFPRSKLLTPAPLLHMEGSVRLPGQDAWPQSAQSWSIENWRGMQGHNWGREHAHEYAWGQCLFPDAKGQPLCMVEAFTGRVAMGGIVSPAMSAMVVRRRDVSYRFDRVFRLWRQKAKTDDMRWELELRGDSGQALLVMEARPERMALLGYQNPDGTLAYCFNSKLSRTHLRVNPADGQPFQCISEHGGALEFLRREHDDRFGDPI